MIDRRGSPAVTLAAAVLFLSILLFAGTGTAAGAVGCEPINSSTVINESGCYELTGDALNSPNETYVEIQASDVVLDGMGHTIDGDDSSNSMGVFVNGSTGDRLSNVTVKNLTLTDWETGLYYDTSGDGAILNVTAASNTEYGLNFESATNVAVAEVTTAEHADWGDAGIRIFGGSGHTIRDSSFTDEYTGVDVLDAQQVTVRDSTFKDTSPAVDISDSGGVVVDKNTIVDGSLGAISGTNGPTNRITNNSIYESSQYATGADCYGMTIDGAADDVIANNSWTECDSGVHIDDSDRIEFRNNTISGTDGANADYGLWVSGGADNRIVDNHIVDNGKYPKRAGILLGTHQAYLSGNTLTGNGFNLEIGNGGNWSSLSHTIDATNTVEGRPVAYHVNETGVTVDPNAGWVGLIGTQNAVVADMDFAANNRQNVLLRYADDTIIRNVTTSPSWVGVQTRDGSDRTRIENSHFENGRGLSFYEAPGTTIVNTSMLNSNGYGVFLSESPDTSFENVTIVGSSRKGIGVRNGESGTVRVTVANSTVSNNGGGGIDFYRAARSSVRESVIQNNGGAGVQTQWFVHNVTITGNVIRGNDGDGVTFDNEPKDNLVAGNTITDNAGNGIELGWNGRTDTLYGNVLTGNAAGLYVPSTYDNLTVYDNHLNNTQNVVVSDPMGLTNATWNLTAISGTNIVGGSTIGGNYWANQSGDGFSQTCTDRGDGICDSAFTIEGSHVDHLPLTIQEGEGDSENGGDSGDDPENGTVIASSIIAVNGTSPDMNNVSLDAFYSGGLLQVQLTNDTADPDDLESRYELEGVGADETTEFTLDIQIENATSRVLVGSGNVSDWDVAPNGDGTTNITIRTRPIEVQSIFDDSYVGGVPDLNDWPEGENDTATEQQNATVQLAVDSVDFMDTAEANTLNGTILATDAQAFGSPIYTPASGGQPPELSLFVAGPHNTTTGEQNQGFYDALLPKALLDAWGVTDPENELEAAYAGQSAAIDVNETAGGEVRISIDIHYSAGEISISATTEGGSSGDGGDTGGDSGNSDPGSSDDEPTTTLAPTTETTPTPTTTTEDTSPLTADTPTQAGEDTPLPPTSETTQPTQAPATTSSPGQPGFGVVVTALALLAAALVAGRRR